MLLSVVCAEDVPRIDRSKIPALTEGSFLGDSRIRAQFGICAAWPRGEVPEGFGDPVTFDGPVLVISGELDPVTPPEWGEEMVRHLPRGRHVAVPRAHDVNSPCVDSFASAFLHEDPLAPLDLSCVDEMELPPFEVD
jgi:pimeloyl-ACP methyl ester carboxylesterase